MKRWQNTAINVALATASVAAVFLAALLADRAVDTLLPRPPFPGPVGILYQPRLELHWKMYDYTCVERINALGFRDREIALEKGNAYRVMAIGDSFTYGWGVNLEDSWLKVLERNLRNRGVDVEILNLGKPAANPRQYRVIAEKALPLLKPDLIVVGILAGEDVQNLDPGYAVKDIVSHAFPGFSRFPGCYPYLFGKDWPQILPRTQSEKESNAQLVATAQEMFRKIRSKQRLRFDALETPVKEAFFDGTLNPWLIMQSTNDPEYFLRWAAPGSLGYRLKLMFMTRQLRLLRETAARYGVPVVALSLPEGFLVNDTAYANVQRIGFRMAPELLLSTGPDRTIHEACVSAGSPFFEVSQGFRDRRDETGLYFEFDRHMTAAGNKLYGDLITPIVAQAIADAPRKNK